MAKNFTALPARMAGASITTLSQIAGSATSSFRLNCNGSETSPQDCLMERRHSADSYCRRTVIECFVTDPDPQLCNVSLPTTSPELTTSTTESESITLPSQNTYKATESDGASAKLHTPTSLLPAPTTGDLEPMRESEGTSNNKIMIIVGIVMVMVTMAAGITCLGSLTVTCLSFIRRKRVHQTKREKEKLQLHDTAGKSKVTSEWKQERQREGEDYGYQYAENNAYHSRQKQINGLCQRPSDAGGGVLQLVDDAPSHCNEQQHEVEPIYEIIPA